MQTDPLDRLVLELARLPGIGERTARRLAFYILKASQNGTGGHSLAHDLAHALTDAVERIGFCRDCRNLSAQDRCTICNDPRRDGTLLCVVESVQDLRAIEASSAFRGLYHVLHGSLSPLDGIGPSELRIDDFLVRISNGDFTEIVLATNANVEGDATALYLAQRLRGSAIKTTRLASGIPLGGELEYIDQATLSRAVTQRRDF